MNKGLLDSGRMGLLNSHAKCLPSHSYPPKLKEDSAVHSQVPILPIHLSALWASNSPTSLRNDRQGSEAHGPLQGNPN